MVDLAQYPEYFGSNISFELDGTLEGSFLHVVDTSGGFKSLPPHEGLGYDIEPAYLYNQNVFSKTGLDNQNHTLVMTAMRGANASLLLFDWAQYT